jgi:uncharacterized repeat protein (TIGR03803 family)
MRTKKLLSALALACLSVVLSAVLFPAAWAAPKYTILHGFTGGKDGGYLQGSLTLDDKGNVYGATFLDTIFEVSPRSGGGWHFQLLLTLDNGSGANGGMLLHDGELWGTTQACCPSGYGEVFKLSTAQGRWKEAVIYHFHPPKPVGAPWDGPIMDKAGNLYGTAGSAYELYPGSDSWKLTVLHKFPSFDGDGAAPYAGLVMDAVGNLYGTTNYGGGSKSCDAGCGTAYELSPEGDGKWKETILHRFGSSPRDGASPSLGALAIDSNGNLYGTTSGGGQPNKGQCGGTIFKLTPEAGGKWKESILYGTFGEGVGGCEPGGGVVLDNAGNLYGTTIAGGDPNCGCGVVYELSPGKDGKWTYTVLHTFVGSDGAQPDANLVIDDKGNLYGTTLTGGPGGVGVAFEITP